MTRFVKEQFQGTEYVEYCLDPMPCAWDRRKFVARFKYAKNGRASFITFLIKNFTVEEYFARLAAGEAPLAVLESKGYLLPHIKKWLRRDGYAVSPAGFRQMVQDQIAARAARLTK